VYEEYKVNQDTLYTGPLGKAWKFVNGNII